MITTLVSAATFMVTIVFVISAGIVASNQVAALIVMLMLCFGYSIVQVRPVCFELSVLNLPVAVTIHDASSPRVVSKLGEG